MSAAIFGGFWRWGFLIVLLCFAYASGAAEGPVRQAAPPRQDRVESPHSKNIYRAWGEEALAHIERLFRKPDANEYYADEGRREVMHAWPAGVCLIATAQAARVAPERYRTRLTEAITGLDAYWNPAGPVPGYDSSIHPTRTDRYYDDNCWIALGLIDAYKQTRAPELMRHIEAAYRYIFSGEDKVLGGGIYWRENWEQDGKSKNTCANAPAAVVALELYGLTGARHYLDDGQRIMDWLKPNLQDPADHLFWDNKKVSGQVSQAKYSYNTAMPIQAWLLLHKHTGKAEYLKDAEQAAAGALARWFDPERGTLSDTAPFAFTLAEAFLRLSDADHNPRWRACVTSTAAFIHDKGRDAQGRYPSRWNRDASAPTPTPNPMRYRKSRTRKYEIIHAAPTAWLFWRLAE